MFGLTKKEWSKMKRISFIPSLPLAVCLILGALAFGTGSAYGGWQLVWSDEFTNADGSSPDPTKWGYDTGAWPDNAELEYYTTRTNNARIQGGNLVIEADQENYGGRSYTSARLKTQYKWSWAYGRIEARIKIPKGQGIWPAFWMLGTNIDSVSWPTCGEIDIMENIGTITNNEQSKAHGTIHGPQDGHDYNYGSGVGGTYTLPGGAILSDDFHIYAIEWTTNQIKWFVDTNLYFTATPASLPSDGIWVFTAPEFIILNVAVGGQWPGNPDATTVFPQQMLLDYVRVYSYVASVPDVPTGLTVGAGNGTAYLTWNAANGATAYNVKRAMNSGGPYTTIATPTTNSYADTSVSTCTSYYYVVSATNSLGESSNSSEAAVTLGTFALAVNSGGGAAGQFIADTNFTGGTASSSSATIDTSAVTNPAPQAVYQTERFGACTYTFTNLTQNVNYKVRLHFAEFYWTSVGQRVFNVSINGKQVLTNYDIIAAAGAADKANIQEFMTTPTSTNTIVIKYTTVTDNAKSSGIEILLPPPAAPVGLTATAGDSLVSLKWNTSSGATSYNVKRSLVSGGPYTLLSGGLTVTNCTDSVVTNGTTYYYVVSAVNAGCESTNSIQASAMPTNHPPVLAAISNQTIMAGRTLLVTNSASDADSPPQTLTFSLLTAPTNAGINSSSGVFNWRPTIAQSPSTQSVSVVVADNGVPIMSATQGFTVTVTQPAVPALTTGSITAGQFGFWIYGDSGPDYTILASTNLTSWNPIFTINSPSLPYYWVDTNSAAYPDRYYRTLLGP